MVEIVGCGLGRTGTTSLKIALEKLGMPTYHMVDLNTNVEEDLEKWQKIAACNGEGYDWNDLFVPSNGRPPYRATVDWPGATYYKSLLAAYPDAKVILTVRDSPEKWLESVKSTIYAPNRNQPPAMEKLKRDIIWDHPDMFDGKFNDNAIQVYNDWILQVKEVVPSNKLLIFNVKEGWAPLCNFLGVPLVNEAFPHANDRESFIQRRLHVNPTTTNP